MAHLETNMNLFGAMVQYGAIDQSYTRHGHTSKTTHID